MRKKLIFMKHLIVLFLFSSACHAQSGFDKAGFGSNFNEGNLIIYMPIQFKTFIIEPTVRWSSYEINERSYNGSVDEYDTSIYEIGIGVFSKNEVYENTFINYGVRVGYSEGEYVSRYTSSAPFYSYSDFRKQESETYFVSPTISFEYFLFPQISIGTNIGLIYTKTVRTYKDSDSDARYENRATLRKGATYTTEAIVRFYF